MKLLVFGAAGGTGRELVMQALAQAHEVTAVVRSPPTAPVCGTPACEYWSEVPTMLAP